MSIEQSLTQLQQVNAELHQGVNALTQEVTSKIGEIDSKLSQTTSEAKQKVDSYIALSRDKQSHYRITKNQALIPNDASTMPKFWSQGFVKSAKLIETVTTGTEPEQRSDLAREFLRAINSDRKYFANSFKIWELEYYPNRRGDDINNYAYLMYQYFRTSNYITVAAIVKHIKGVVPDSWWCGGLEANQQAKVCGSHSSMGGRNFYSHCHPYVRGAGKAETETGIIQVALPAVVTGDVDLTGGDWGQFAYLGDADQPAFD